MEPPPCTAKKARKGGRGSHLLVSMAGSLAIPFGVTLRFPWFDALRGVFAEEKPGGSDPTQTGGGTSSRGSLNTRCRPNITF